jgi:transcriptional regulator with XRE-family HTH domain
MVRRPSKVDIARQALATHVRVYRAKMDISQTEFGAAAGMSQQEVSRIEKQKARPSLARLARIAQVLDVEIPDLLVPPDGKK